MRGLLLLSLGFLIAGCVNIGPAQPNCAEITSLRSQISKATSVEQLTAWITDTYHVSGESISVDATSQLQGYLVEWQKTGLWYDISIEKGVVTDIGVWARGISAGDVIACLGQPAQYSANYGMETEGGKQLDLALLFPEQGVLAVGARILPTRPQQPPALANNFPITRFLITQPATVDEMLNHFFDYYAPDLAKWTIDGYKPWPEAWKAIELRTNPYSSPKVGE